MTVSPTTHAASEEESGEVDDDPDRGVDDLVDEMMAEPLFMGRLSTTMRR